MKHTMIFGMFLALLVAGPAMAQQPGQTQQGPPQQPPAAAPSARPQEPVITREVNLVNLVFTVMNRRQKFVTDLDKPNFRVLEEGQEQAVSFFSRQTDLPLRVGILLDTSNSIRDRLKFEQEAAIDFLHNVVRRKKDMAFLMTFDSEAGLVEDFTDDLNKLTEAIKRQRAGGGTALYGAIKYACSEKLINPPLAKGANPEVRRVLVVISDGLDSDPPGPSRTDAIETCQRAEAAIYTISTSTDWMSVSGDTPKKFHKTDGDKILEQFSDETGGRAFFPYRIDDLAQSFLDIGDELRSQYALGYYALNKNFDGRFRKVEIKVDRQGLRVRSRKGYFASVTRPVVRPPAQ